jgi:hypothetical protein
MGAALVVTPHRSGRLARKRRRRPRPARGIAAASGGCGLRAVPARSPPVMPPMLFHSRHEGAPCLIPRLLYLAWQLLS